MAHGVVCGVAIDSRGTQDKRVKARDAARWLSREMMVCLGVGICRMVVSLMPSRAIGCVELRKSLTARVGKGPRDQLVQSHFTGRESET